VIDGSCVVCYRVMLSRSFLIHAKAGSLIGRLPRSLASTINFQCRLLTSSETKSSNSAYNPTIVVSPLGVSSSILPGGMVEKVNKKTGQISYVNVERAFGYFWMLGDLRKNGGKPVLSNDCLIPAELAKPFPRLDNLKSLTGEDSISLPDFFQKVQNRSAGPPSSQCTLCVISFKQFGYEKLKRWIEAFETSIMHGIGPNARAGQAKIVEVSIVQGSFYKLLQGVMKSTWQTSTPKERHSTTLLHFGSEEDTLTFRDNLRMHNVLTAYVTLVDDQGRVRWMGSGEPTEKELTILIDCARELTKPTNARRKIGNFQ